MLFIFPDFTHFKKPLTQVQGIKTGKFSINRFPNQEISITVKTPVAGKKCLIIGSLSPPEENLVATLLLAHTLRKEGANDLITALLPYLAYSRQDKDEPHESLTTQWVGEVIAASQINKVVTIDAHSLLDEQLFPLPLVSLSPAPVFASEILKRGFNKATIVAPDTGAIHRGHNVLLEAEMQRFAYLEKKRTNRGVTHWQLHGDVGKKAVVVDDILDTGSTLVSCCQQLVAGGTQEIIVMVTHGLFTGKKWQELWDLGVKTIYTTDTVPQPTRTTHERVVTLSSAPVLVNYLNQQ